MTNKIVNVYREYGKFGYMISGLSEKQLEVHQKMFAEIGATLKVKGRTH